MIYKRTDFHKLNHFSLCKNTGSRSTFEFPSRVNLSGPSLYCIARTMGKHWQTLNRTSLCDKVAWSDFSLNLLLLKGEGCVYFHSYCSYLSMLIADFSQQIQAMLQNSTRWKNDIICGYLLGGDGVSPPLKKLGTPLCLQPCL